MNSFLYALLVRPIELLIELSYVSIHKAFSNEAISIVCSSIIIQTLMFIIYGGIIRFWKQNEKSILRKLELIIYLIIILIQIPVLIASRHYYIGLGDVNGSFIIGDNWIHGSTARIILFWGIGVVWILLCCLAMYLISRYPIKERSSGLKNKAKNLQVMLPNLYLWEAGFLVLFVGAIIPFVVVSSSPTEFITVNHGPIHMILMNTALLAGVFFIWFAMFFFLSSSKTRFVVILLLTSSIGIAYVNSFYFGNGFGTMTPLFEYDHGIAYSSITVAINLVVIIIVACACIVVVLNWPDVLLRIVQILVACAFCACIYFGWSVTSQVNDLRKSDGISMTSTDEDIYHFSKKGKNVVVILMDRAIGSFIPYIFDEKPDIAKMYEGFTYYSNTISFAEHTNFCTPALFGGYEYTPFESNKRDNVSLKDKHNEALLLMPRLFSENGYNVMVTDPPYAGNYELNNDLSMYSSVDNVSAYNLKGTYIDEYNGVFAEPYEEKQESSAFYYSIMRTAPVFLQSVIYNEGNYLSLKSVGVNMTFLEEYSTLTKLPDITDISEGDENNCLMVYNCATHDVSAFTVPDYSLEAGAREQLNTLKEYYKNEAFSGLNGEINLDSILQIAHYQSNLASLKALGEWFDYLRKNGCYDNTRIVLVADHGFALNNFDDMIFENGMDVESYNPLLMVKDFNEDSYVVSNEFMTIADVPTITLDGLIDNPVNPFTGAPINSNAKMEPQMVTTSHNYSTIKNNGNTFDTDDGEWYRVTPGDFKDSSNWEKCVQ